MLGVHENIDLQTGVGKISATHFRSNVGQWWDIYPLVRDIWILDSLYESTPLSSLTDYDISLNNSSC